jgi:hypothetical protein
MGEYRFIKSTARKINHFFGRGKKYVSRALSLKAVDAAIKQAVVDNEPLPKCFLRNFV